MDRADSRDGDYCRGGLDISERCGDFFNVGAEIPDLWDNFGFAQPIFFSDSVALCLKVRFRELTV